MTRLFLLAAAIAAGTAVTTAGAQTAGTPDADTATSAATGGDGPRGGRPDFATLDTDGSGEITEEDLIARRNAAFAEIDTDGDGAVSESEYVAAAERRAAEAAAERFAALDVDGDGSLSQDVLSGRRGGPRMGARMIERLDADGSGGVSEDEFAEMRDRGHGMGRRGEARRGPRDGRGGN